MSTVGVLGVPSSIGARRAGTEKAPAALRAAGLVAGLQDAVGALGDYGDLPEVVFQPDTANPQSQNLDRVCEVVADVSRHTDAIVADGSMPLILGGDCTVSIGVLASLARKHKRLGLIYFDGDLDLNTPEVTPSGIFDGMVLAHITGKGAPKLAGIGPRCPLVPEHQVAVFGFNPDAGWIDPYELQALAKSSMIQFSLSDIRTSANAQARKALSQLENRSDAILLHFDVDVLDAEEFPAVDVAHKNGLALEAAFDALQAFLGSPKLAGLVITEFNPNQDATGTHARQLSGNLRRSFKLARGRTTGAAGR